MECGKNNSYGHPNNAVIKRLTEKNIKIYRTDEAGEIILEINKNGKIATKNSCKKQIKPTVYFF